MDCENWHSRKRNESAGARRRWARGHERPRGGDPATYPLEEVLGSVLRMPVLAGFRSYARCPCSSPREKLGPVPVTTGAVEGDREENEGKGKVQGGRLPRRRAGSCLGAGGYKENPFPNWPAS